VNGGTPRPVYGQFAWAYDLLMERPVEAECDAIACWLTERGVAAGASILDAGCGTGRYAVALGRRGYVVHGIDRSPELVAEGRKAAADGSAPVTFAVGDLRTLAMDSTVDAVLCRGVLNDVTASSDREAILSAFARALRLGGVLILDGRDWDASVERKTREPVLERAVETSRGRLTFRSVTRLDRPNRRLIIEERHRLEGEAGTTTADYEFVMRCWSRDEKDGLLARAGFGSIEYFGACDPQTPVAATDRLVAVASRLDDRIRVIGTYRLATAVGRFTEELVRAGAYGYAHSCVTTENFPSRSVGDPRAREIVVLAFDRDVTSEDAIAAAARMGLTCSEDEDALYFGCQHPDVQREGPLIFLHDPWFACSAGGTSSACGPM
jgi:SAM-dependent methyltransferase